MKSFGRGLFLLMCISVLFVQNSFSSSSFDDDHRAHTLLVKCWSDIYHNRKDSLSKSDKEFLSNMIYRHALRYNDIKNRGSAKLIELLNTQGSKDLSKIILDKLGLKHSKHVKKALGV